MKGEEVKFGKCPFSLLSTDWVAEIKVERNEDAITIKETKQGQGVSIGHSVRCPAFEKGEIASTAIPKYSIACCIVPERINPITKEKEVLITRRKETMRAFPNVWVFPGGHVDHGETLQQAALRELKEETGIEIEERELTFTAMWESIFPPTKEEGPMKKQHLIFFYSIILSDEESRNIKLCEIEVSAAGWINKQNIELLLYYNQQNIPKEGNKDIDIFHLPDGNIGETFSGYIMMNNGLEQCDFNTLTSLCGKDCSLGKERLSSATSFVLKQWYLKNK